MDFEYTLKVLGLEIKRLETIPGNERAKTQLQKAIEILRDGQGYLTSLTPIKVVFYDADACK